MSSSHCVNIVIYFLAWVALTTVVMIKANEVCTGVLPQGKILTANSGQIKTDIDGAGPTEYLPGLNCSWLIQCANGMGPVLQSEGSISTQDNIKIYRGSSIFFSLMYHIGGGTFRSTQLPFPANIGLDVTEVLVVFYSRNKASTGRSGMVVSYTCEPIVASSQTFLQLNTETQKRVFTPRPPTLPDPLGELKVFSAEFIIQCPPEIPTVAYYLDIDTDNVRYLSTWQVRGFIFGPRRNRLLYKTERDIDDWAYRIRAWKEFPAPMHLLLVTTTDSNVTLPVQFRCVRDGIRACQQLPPEKRALFDLPVHSEILSGDADLIQKDFQMVETITCVWRVQCPKQHTLVISEAGGNFDCSSSYFLQCGIVHVQNGEGGNWGGEKSYLPPYIGFTRPNQFSWQNATMPDHFSIEKKMLDSSWEYQEPSLNITLVSWSGGVNQNARSNGFYLVYHCVPKRVDDFIVEKNLLNQHLERLGVNAKSLAKQDFHRMLNYSHYDVVHFAERFDGERVVEEWEKPGAASNEMPSLVDTYRPARYQKNSFVIAKRWEFTCGPNHTVAAALVEHRFSKWVVGFAASTWLELVDSNNVTLPITRPTITTMGKNEHYYHGTLRIYYNGMSESLSNFNISMHCSRIGKVQFSVLPYDFDQKQPPQHVLHNLVDGRAQDVISGDSDGAEHRYVMSGPYNETFRIGCPADLLNQGSKYPLRRWTILFEDMYFGCLSNQQLLFFYSEGFYDTDFFPMNFGSRCAGRYYKVPFPPGPVDVLLQTEKVLREYADARGFHLKYHCVPFIDLSPLQSASSVYSPQGILFTLTRADLVNQGIAEKKIDSNTIFDGAHGATEYVVQYRREFNCPKELGLHTADVHVELLGMYPSTRIKIYEKRTGVAVDYTTANKNFRRNRIYTLSKRFTPPIEFIFLDSVSQGEPLPDPSKSFVNVNFNCTQIGRYYCENSWTSQVVNCTDPQGIVSGDKDGLWGDYGLSSKKDDLDQTPNCSFNIECPVGHEVVIDSVAGRIANAQTYAVNPNKNRLVINKGNDLFYSTNDPQVTIMDNRTDIDQVMTQPVRSYSRTVSVNWAGAFVTWPSYDLSGFIVGYHCCSTSELDRSGQCIYEQNCSVPSLVPKAHCSACQFGRASWSGRPVCLVGHCGLQNCTADTTKDVAFGSDGSSCECICHEEYSGPNCSQCKNRQQNFSSFCSRCLNQYDASSFPSCDKVLLTPTTSTSTENSSLTNDSATPAAENTTSSSQATAEGSAATATTFANVENSTTMSSSSAVQTSSVPPTTSPPESTMSATDLTSTSINDTATPESTTSNPNPDIILNPPYLSIDPPTLSATAIREGGEPVTASIHLRAKKYDEQWAHTGSDPLDIRPLITLRSTSKGALGFVPHFLASTTFAVFRVVSQTTVQLIVYPTPQYKVENNGTKETVNVTFDKSAFASGQHDGFLSFVIEQLTPAASPRVAVNEQLADTSVVVVSAASSVGAMASASGVAAAQAARGRALMEAEICTESWGPLPKTAHPLQFSLGSEKTKYYAGAMVGLPPLVIAPFVLHVILVGLIGSLREQVWVRSAAALRFPSLDWLLVMFFAQDGITSCIVVMLHTEALHFQFLAGLILLAFWMVLPAMCVYITVFRGHFPAFILPSARSPLGVFVLGKDEWLDTSEGMDGGEDESSNASLLLKGNEPEDDEIDAGSVSSRRIRKKGGNREKDFGFMNRYDLIFACYVPERRWFMAVEFFVILGMGVAVGIKPPTDDCQNVHISLLAIFAAYCLAIGLLRPYIAWKDTILMGLITVLQLVAAGLLFLKKEGLTGTIALAAMYVATLKGVTDLIFQVMDWRGSFDVPGKKRTKKKGGRSQRDTGDDDRENEEMEQSVGDSDSASPLLNVPMSPSGASGHNPLDPISSSYLSGGRQSSIAVNHVEQRLKSDPQFVSMYQRL